MTPDHIPEIYCDDESYSRCRKEAAVVLRLTHMKNTCEPQTIALCAHHIQDWIFKIKKVQNDIKTKGPLRCPRCKDILNNDYILCHITQLKGNEE